MKEKNKGKGKNKRVSDRERRKKREHRIEKKRVDDVLLCDGSPEDDASVLVIQGEARLMLRKSLGR